MKDGTKKRLTLSARLSEPLLRQMIKCRAKLARLRTQSEHLEKSLDDCNCETGDNGPANE